MDLSNGRKVNWVLSRNSDPNTNNWTEISDTETASTSFEYTPVTADVGTYLQFKATYRDNQDSTQDRTEFSNTDNTVLAQPPVNGAPTFDEGATAMRTLPEDAANLHNIGDPVSASDPDDDELTYILNGRSAAPFKISNDGQLQVQQRHLLDYEEKPTHRFQVLVSDGKDADGNPDPDEDATIFLTVELTNVEEPGYVRLSSDSPQVGVQLRADIIDPDRNVRNVVWQWQTAATADSQTWSDIGGATDYLYTPTPSDVGKYLRAQATYDDILGTGKEASLVAANPVARPANEPPEFDEEGPAIRRVPENSPPGTRVGAAVSATDPEGDTLTYSLVGGVHSGNFTIEPSTGRLQVSPDANLDYEANRSFLVELTVSDGKDASHEQDSSVDDTIEVIISLVNVDEPGEVTLSSMEPKVGAAIKATVTDVDGGVSDTTWGWQKSQDGVNDWEDIADESTDTYMPSDDDVDMYLRAMAEYTDEEGPGKNARGMTDDPVGEDVFVDTSLQSLTMTGISIPFHRDTLRYSHSVPNDVTSTTVTAVASAASDVDVQIVPSDDDGNSDGHQVALTEGVNEITIVVTEKGGDASTTYMVQVTRLSPQPEPQQDPATDPEPEPDNDPEPTPSLADDCREDERNGLIANCIVTDFAVIRVEHDGSFNIDWSEWDSGNPDATGYSISLRQMIYRSYFSGSTEASDDELADVYESCEFQDDRWSCEGRLQENYYIDWNGNPLEVQVLASDVDITEWNSSLDVHGILVADQTYQRWSGNAADPENDPVAVTYTTKSFEIRLHFFQVHEDGRTVGRETIAVNGANGFDER